MTETTPQFDSRVKAIEWLDGKLRLLDQRILPGQVAYLDYDNVTDVAHAITDMVVRGAPAIGITAAYGVVLAARAAYQAAAEDWQRAIEDDLTTLAAARPTAVNLHWAIKTMRASFADTTSNPEQRLLEQAKKIHNEDIAANQRMGELGAALIGKNETVMTHCNAGALATGGYGTALGVIRSAWAKGQITEGVIANETRPWLQGARLTAWELIQDDIPVTLIADTAASHVMSLGKTGWIIVGADRIAANGDVANKIGTSQLAIAAKHHGVKFMVAAPLSTIDLDTASGKQIPIEGRQAEEVLGYAGSRIAPEKVNALNPAFDITPAELIDAIVTEQGVVEAPDKAKIQSLFDNRK